MNRKQLTTLPAIFDFVTAGNATFTLVSKATQTRFTYRVSQPVDKETGKIDRDGPYFVALLNGSDNKSSFAFTGWWWRAGDRMPRRSAKGRVSTDAASSKAIDWFLKHVLSPQSSLDFLNKVECWHEGKCARCGRKLTVPESIDTGFGPECSAKLGVVRFKAEAVPAAPKARVRKVAKTYDRPFDDSLDDVMPLPVVA